MQVLLETERLVLRRFTAADADCLFELDNDPEVMRFINGGTPTPRDVVQNDILPGFLHYDDCFSGYGVWAAIEKSTERFLGWLSLRPAESASNEVNLGYRLRKDAWGKGYATEGARALVRKGFSELGVHRVVATTYEENLASRRVMEKLGMTLVRKFRFTSEDLKTADTYHVTDFDPWDGDDVEYALERADWERQDGEIMESQLNVSYASMAELDWIEENDGHIPKQMIGNKVKAGEYIIAKVADEPVGCLRFGHFWSTIPYIEVIWVEDRFQRRGIGRAMVCFLEDHARTRGQRLIMSSSQADEPGAQAFHRKIGFRDAGALVDLRPLQSVTEVVFVKEV